MAKKMKNQNPPRRVEIRGQDHLLAYITPAEAQLLMDNGGSGEPGPMGIPSFYEKDRPGLGGAGEKGASGGFGGDFGGGPDKDNDKGAVDPGLAKAVAEKAAQQAVAKSAELERISGLTPGQATAMFGDATMAGMGVTSADIDRVLGDATVSKEALSGILPALQSRARRAEQLRTLAGALSPIRAIASGLLGKMGYDIPAPVTAYDDLATLLSMPKSRIAAGTFLEPDAVLFSPVEGAYSAFGYPAGLSQQWLGNVAYTGGYLPDYVGPFQDQVRGTRFQTRGGDGQDVVPAIVNPVTNEKQCPDGYVFDADLQACRVAAPLANVGETVGGTGFDYQPGTYARMGLLDEAPIGLEQFASTYGTGFGTAPDYEAANLAYRKPVGTMSGIFQDPYNLQGMTLLA